MKENQDKINEAIIFNELGKDHPSKALFKNKIFLANFLKQALPMFKNMSVEEIIIQSIDWFDGKEGNSIFQLFEESNSFNEPVLSEDFIVMLRFPDYMQGKDKPEHFILHVEFQNYPVGFLLRKMELSLYLNKHFDITSDEENEEVQLKNLIPIYSIWIVLDPDEEDKGSIDNLNYIRELRLDPKNENTYSEKIVLDTTTNIQFFRINLDKNLKIEFKVYPNILSFLKSFFYPKNEEELENALDLFKIEISDELKEEIKKFDSEQ